MSLNTKSHTHKISFSEDESSFYIKGDNQECKVPIIVSSQASNVTAQSVFHSEIFSDWANQYAKSKDYVLKNVEIQKADLCGTIISSLTFAFTSCLVSDDTPVTNTVTLKGKNVILVILVRDEDQKKEHLIFTQTCDAVLGTSHYFAIPKGHFNEEGIFECKISPDMGTKLGFTIEQSDCVNLTDIAYNGSHIMFPTQSSTLEITDVYFYKRNISSAALHEIQNRFKGEPNGAVCNLVLKTLNDSWAATVDPRSMCAIFLLHELRHHGRMASTTTTKDGRKKMLYLPTTKRKPQFTNVAQLDPYSGGSNLLVKVHSGPTNETERTKADGTTVKEAHAVVGDNSGIVTIKVINDQLNEVIEGAKLLIQNVKIDMVENRMLLAVDQWGKITSDAALLDEYDFTFEVNTDKDLSKQEYELVMMQENGGHQNNYYRDYRGRGGGRGGRSRGAYRDYRGRGGRGGPR